MFDAASAVDVCVAASDISDLRRTSSGLNIVGGHARVHGCDVLLKFVDRGTARAQCAADALKPLFGQPRIGCRHARLADRYVCGGRSRAAGASMLLLRWLPDLETAKECSARLHGVAAGIDLRAADGPLFVAWLQAVCLRLLVCGARDPWSNTAWSPALRQFVSFDEGTAFTDEMRPGAWTYFARPMKLRDAFRKQLLLDGAPVVRELAARWRGVAVESVLAEFYAGEQLAAVSAYVTGNVAALEANFARLCGSGAARPLPAPTPFAEPPAAERAYNRQPFLGGYCVAEAKSWLQKAARRGLAEQCRFAAALMLASQNITNLEHRLLTMCVEDCVSPALVVEIGRRWAALAAVRAAVPWRAMRDLACVREDIAAMADAISAAPASRLADHVGALFFREDHPWAGGTPAWAVPPDVGTSGGATAAFAARVERCRAGEWSLALERELLFLAGGVWSLAGGHPIGMLATVARQPKAGAPPLLAAVLGVLQQMMQEIHGRDKKRGKLFLIAGIVFFARAPPAAVPPEHALDWGALPAPPPAAPVADEYARLQSGAWRLCAPAWVHDLHCGRREAKSEFVVREQAALVGAVPPDPYYAEALAALRAREQAAAAKPQVKRVCK